MSDSIKYFSESEGKLVDPETMNEEHVRNAFKKLLKEKYSYKVNISKDILVTEEQRLKFLDFHNKLKDTVDYISECYDIQLSQVTMLSELLHHLHSSLKFVPQKNDDATGSAYWKDFVLSEDELAWKYDVD